MQPQRLEFAFEHIRPSQWELFEKLASAFFATEFDNLRTMASAGGDRGRDAELFSSEVTPSVVLQYSITPDWEKKIEDTIDRLAEVGSEASLLIYATNQTIGAKADDLRKKLREHPIRQRFHLDIRDCSWFIERCNSSPAREGSAEAFSAQIVDPLLASSQLIETKAQALSTLEARAGLVYLSLQWRNEAQEKGLTRVCFEALVRAALRNTSSENRMTRQNVHDILCSYLSTHSRSDVVRQTDAALLKLTKKVLRHWPAPDEFCLTHEETVRLRARLVELEARDGGLQQSISDTVLKHLSALKISDEKLRVDLLHRTRRVLEKFLLGRGEIFVMAVKTGHMEAVGFEPLKDVVIADASTHALPKIKGIDRIPDIVCAVIREVLIEPDVSTHEYLRSLSDSYTLMAFLHETPDIQSLVSKLFSYGEIWLDTSVILPLFAEELVDPTQRLFGPMLMAANEAGMQLRVTHGVITEVERHLNLSLACARSHAGWTGRTPFLFQVYLASGRPRSDFPAWIDQYCGTSRPEDDVTEFLQRLFSINIKDLGEEVNLIPADVKLVADELWSDAHEHRRGRHQNSFDPAVQRRMVQTDMENYLGVIARRRNEQVSDLGFKHWWLTIDQIAWQVHKQMRQRLVGKAPQSPLMSPDFLINSLAFGPCRARLSKPTEARLPVVLDVDELPSELLEIAESVREESKQLSEHVIRRKVRDACDQAKRRVGNIASAGLQGRASAYGNKK